MVGERWDAADGVARRLTHLLGVGGAGRRRPEVGSQRVLVDAVRAAGDDDGGVVTDDEDDARRYLGDVTADRRGGIGGGLRPLGELLGVDRDAQSLADAVAKLLGTRMHGYSSVVCRQKSGGLSARLPVLQGVVLEVVLDVVSVVLEGKQLLAQQLGGGVVAEVRREFDVFADRLDDVPEHLHVVGQRGADVVHVVVLGCDGSVCLVVRAAGERHAAQRLGALREFVGTLLEVFGDLAQELVDLQELRTLDVPVVLFDLVVQHVRRRQVRVQGVDDLLGFLLGQP